MGSDPAAGPAWFDWPGGRSWLARPDGPMERASHALATDGAVWLVDPVDAPGVDDAVGELGDAADRLGVSPVPFDGELADTCYRLRPVVVNRFWREVAIVRNDGSTALVPEALGTARFFRARGERVGVHPGLRPWPPRRRLADLDPDRLLVGHGEPVLDDAGSAVRDALAGARRRAPRVYWRLLVGRLRW